LFNSFEGVHRLIMKSLEEKDESKYSCYAKTMQRTNQIV
jgi:hypothetical protein